MPQDTKYQTAREVIKNIEKQLEFLGVEDADIVVWHETGGSGITMVEPHERNVIQIYAL